MIHSTSLRATGSEMAVQEWIAVVGAKTAYIERGSPWENGYIQATSTRGVRACIRRVAGCATPTGFAGHASATANLKLTFHPDHSLGANHPPARPTGTAE